MPLIIRDLATVTFSSGAVNSPAFVNLDDASAIGLYTQATTSLLTIQIEPTDTGANWLPLLALTTGGSAMTVSSSGATLIGTVAFRQLRLVSTAAVNSATAIAATKQITV